MGTKALGVLFEAERGGIRRRLEKLWKRTLCATRRAPRHLRLCETLPLGERRFVAVVEFDAQRFLVGGTASSLFLLSRLTDLSKPIPENSGGEEAEFREQASKNGPV